VLGVSRNHAYSLFSRARDQLEASVAVLVVGRSGRKDCAALDRLLSGWDGRLTATLRKRVGRHIDRCLVCSDRRRQELQPAMLLSLTPGALLAAAIARNQVPALAGAATRLSGPPPALRDAVLRLASGTDPHAVAFRAAVGRSTRSFGINGFPKPPHHGHLGLTSLPHLPLGVVGGTAVAATATVVATAVGPYAHHRPPAAPASANQASMPAPGRGVSAVPVGAPTGTGRQRLSVAGSATAHRTRAAPSGSGGTVSASVPASGSPGTTVTSTVAASASPTLPVTPTPSATATITQPPLAGTLTVAPTTVVLNPLLGGTLTLTASGGPVTWSISEPASLLGSLTVTPSSGIVYPGSPVTVTLTVSGLTSLDSTLSVSPGQQVVTVLLGLGATLG